MTTPACRLRLPDVLARLVTLQVAVPVAVALAVGGWSGSARAADPRGKPPPPGSPLAELAERARPGVVHVRGSLVERSARGQSKSGSAGVSVGSGFIVDRRGSIVTNEHVVRGATDLRVRLYDGREFSACVLGTDELADVALLRIDPKEPPPVLPLGDSDKVRVGEGVVAIGSPFGFSHSVTAGIVSATERVIDPGNEQSGGQPEDPPYSFYIQTDASINLGNSGGPLIDSTGKVIGINAAFWGGPQPAAGVGFAIPVNVVKLLLPRLREAGEAPRSFLGVESQPVTPVLASAFGLPSLRGALVAAVEKASPAEAAGLEAGDIVTSWGEHPLATRDDFRIFAQLTAPGLKVRVGLLRDGRPLERHVTTRPATRGAARATPGTAASCRPRPRRRWGSRCARWRARGRPSCRAAGACRSRRWWAGRPARPTSRSGTSSCAWGDNRWGAWRTCDAA